MNKPKKSIAAIIMYLIIAISIIISNTCFILYYANIYRKGIILWTGVTFFTIMYHLWLRIIMGNVSKLFKNYLTYDKWWFKERRFENKLCDILCVKKWKGKVLTYNPELFSLKDNSLQEIANTMCKAETDHWINEVISLSSLLFSFIWGEFWIFLITAISAMIFDAQFIVIQKYNRPRVLRILEKRNQ